MNHSSYFESSFDSSSKENSSGEDEDKHSISFQNHRITGHRKTESQAKENTDLNYKAGKLWSALYSKFVNNNINLHKVSLDEVKLRIKFTLNEGRDKTTINDKICRDMREQEERLRIESKKLLPTLIKEVIDYNFQPERQDRLNRIGTTKKISYKDFLRIKKVKINNLGNLFPSFEKKKEPSRKTTPKRQAQGSTKNLNHNQKTHQDDHSHYTLSHFFGNEKKLSTGPPSISFKKNSVLAFQKPKLKLSDTLENFMHSKKNSRISITSLNKDSNFHKNSDFLHQASELFNLLMNNNTKDSAREERSEFTENNVLEKLKAEDTRINESINSKPAISINTIHPSEIKIESNPRISPENAARTESKYVSLDKIDSFMSKETTLLNMNTSMNEKTETQPFYHERKTESIYIKENFDVDENQNSISTKIVEKSKPALIFTDNIKPEISKPKTKSILILDRKRIKPINRRASYNSRSIKHLITLSDAQLKPRSNSISYFHNKKNALDTITFDAKSDRNKSTKQLEKLFYIKNLFRVTPEQLHGIAVKPNTNSFTPFFERKYLRKEEKKRLSDIKYQQFIAATCFGSNTRSNNLKGTFIDYNTFQDPVEFRKLLKVTQMVPDEVIGVQKKDSMQASPIKCLQFSSLNVIPKEKETNNDPRKKDKFMNLFTSKLYSMMSICNLNQEDFEKNMINLENLKGDIKAFEKELNSAELKSHYRDSTIKKQNHLFNYNQFQADIVSLNMAYEGAKTKNRDIMSLFNKRVGDESDKLDKLTFRLKSVNI